MKLTRRQLRLLINEIYTASPEGVISGEEEDRSPSIRVDDRPFGTAPKKGHIAPEVQDMLDMDDPDYTKQAYELSDTLQGYPEGTAQAAVDDEKYAMIMSSLASSPLGAVIKAPPPGFKFVAPVSGTHADGSAYVGVEFFSEAGGLLIDVSLVLSDEFGPEVENSMQINGFAKHTDDVWDYITGTFINNAIANPEEVRASINKIAAVLLNYYPGL